MKSRVGRWTRIEAGNGAISVAQLQRESGYGATRFNQRFTNEFGTSPKTYARLVRFRAALDGLDTSRQLAELALDLGYTDQAHMNRDFRTLGDTTPTEVLATRYADGLTLGSD